MIALAYVTSTAALMLINSPAWGLTRTAVIGACLLGRFVLMRRIPRAFA